MTALTTVSKVPYPVGTDPFGLADTYIKAVADWIEERTRAYAKVYKSAATACVTGVSTVVPFEAEATDTQNLHNPAVNPSRITVAKAGRYRFKTQIAFASNATGYRLCQITSGGVIYGLDARPAVNGALTALSCDATILMTAGAFAEVFVTQTSGGNLNVDLGQASFFEAQWVGEV